MTGEYIVFCTCGSQDEARKLASALVNGHLAACVNILPFVSSIYRWEGGVETGEESLLLIKTTAERLPALQSKLTELHTYDTPEVVAVPIAAGSPKYLAWLRESCAL